MKIHRTTKIYDFNAFKEYVEVTPELNGWSKSIELESKINDSAPYVYICFECENLKHKSNAFVSVVNDNGIAKIANIVPRNGSNLSIDEYNVILLDWVHKYATQSGLRIETSTDNLILQEIVGPAAFAEFQMFAQYANPSTKIGHPTDQNRWFDFVFECARQKISVPEEAIIERLLVHNWNQDAAYSVANEFLPAYEAMTYVILRMEAAHA